VKNKITTSSTAEYFSKNLQQVGFSSANKAVLTTLKESVDNSLDACEDAGILPEISVEIEKQGAGTHKNTDLIRLRVTDNGPGLSPDDLPRVYGEYLASSKFGRGRASRGQQGIGISAATTWAQLTSTRGANIISKTKKMRKAVSGVVEVDIKKNKGVFKNSKTISWDRPHGVSVEFFFDGRLQLNGEGGVLTYLIGSSIVNPHLKLSYKINDDDWIVFERLSKHNIEIPPAVQPHPHTMKLGEYVGHLSLFGKAPFRNFLKKAFSRVSDQTIKAFVKNGIPKALLNKAANSLSNEDIKKTFSAIQNTDVMSPSTKSVLRIGEDALSKSIQRVGDVDFFSVVSRKPKICDAKPVVIEVALARLENSKEEEKSVTVLRFANRVPLQFDKSACAIVKAIESVNWRSYGLSQPRNSLPQGPYIFAISLVSPFIKFKNASKETVDGSNELVEEIRLALMQAGQRLARHIKREKKEAELENKRRHIEQFGPILIDILGRISKVPNTRLDKARKGLMKILGRDADTTAAQLKLAEKKQAEAKIKAEERAKKAAESKTKKKKSKK